MASIAFHASGYRGDVLPYVPIARQLVRRGHDVSFVCPVDFEETFAAEPFRVVIGSRLLPSPTTLDDHAAFVARWGTRLGGLFLPRLYFDRIVLPHLDELYEEALSMCAKADVVVSHPWSHLIVGPAERRGVPTVVGDVFPMLVRSASMPPPGQRDLGRLGNRAAWSMLHAPLINRAWFMGAFRRLRRGCPGFRGTWVTARLGVIRLLPRHLGTRWS